MKTLVRKAAQDRLMLAMLRSINSLPCETQTEIEFWNVSELQFRRAEKLFGYEPGSWELSR